MVVINTLLKTQKTHLALHQKRLDSIWGEISHACPWPLPSHPPEAIARGHRRRWGSLNLWPDAGHPPLCCMQHFEQTGKYCYPHLTPDEVREIRPHGKSMVNWDYRHPVQSLPKDPGYLSSLNGAHKMDFRKGESPETHNLRRHQNP